MHINAGYLYNQLDNPADDFTDTANPLAVGSCGNYRLQESVDPPVLRTFRPVGRHDYQLLYIASGKGHFFFDGKEEIVPAGHMILYRPGEVQEYSYYSSEKTDVYWIHFSGNDVNAILEHYEFPVSGHLLFAGTSPVYPPLFLQIIRELQLQPFGFQELVTSCLRQIFLHIQRQQKTSPDTNDHLLTEINLAREYFTIHYAEPINIDSYAESRHMSTCWFIRNFKEITGTTPLQCLLSLRLANAQNLLKNTDYSVSKIASIVGYENALYFSRLFKKQTGMSPSDCRKRF